LADIPKNVETIARQAWGMAQRVGMHIAGMPPEKREAALAIAENSLRETAKGNGYNWRSNRWVHRTSDEGNPPDHYRHRCWWKSPRWKGIVRARG